MIDNLIPKILNYLRKGKNSVWTENFISTGMDQSLLKAQMSQEESLNMFDRVAPEQDYVPGDLVYVLFNPKERPERQPAVGTSREIDCKILEKLPPWIDGNGKLHKYYKIISGMGHFYEIEQSFIVPARDVDKYRIEKKLISKVDCELFPAGTEFLYRGEYAINEILGVYIHLSRVSKLNNLF